MIKSGICESIQNVSKVGDRSYPYVAIQPQSSPIQSAWAAEYNDCISTEE